MRPFYLNGMMRALVMALVGIFTPIYIYEIAGIGWVIGYYLLIRIVVLFFAIPVSHIIEKIGFRRSIGISLVLLMICYGTLLGYQGEWWLLIISLVASGLNIPFYWLARSSAIAQDSETAHVGRQLGILTSVEAVATMLGPLSAGLIIEQWGFGVMYLAAILILLTSLVPLLSMPPHTHKNGASWEGFVRWIQSRRYFHNAIGIGARAVDDYGLNVLWPLAIFVLGVNTGTVGGIFTLSALVALVVRLVMGRMFDRLHDRRDLSDEWVYGAAAGVNAILWLLRILAHSVGIIVGIDLMGAIFGTTYSSYYVDYEQLGGKRMGSIAYFVYGEMMYSIMAIWLFGMVAVGWYLGIWREVFMILAAFWVLISIIMARESNMK